MMANLISARSVISETGEMNEIVASNFSELKAVLDNPENVGEDGFYKRPLRAGYLVANVLARQSDNIEEQNRIMDTWIEGWNHEEKALQSLRYLVSAVQGNPDALNKLYDRLFKWEYFDPKASIIDLEMGTGYFIEAYRGQPEKQIDVFDDWLGSRKLYRRLECEPEESGINPALYITSRVIEYMEHARDNLGVQKRMFDMWATNEHVQAYHAADIQGVTGTQDYVEYRYSQEYGNYRDFREWMTNFTLSEDVRYGLYAWWTSRPGLTAAIAKGDADAKIHGRYPLQYPGFPGHGNLGCVEIEFDGKPTKLVLTWGRAASPEYGDDGNGVVVAIQPEKSRPISDGSPKEFVNVPGLGDAARQLIARHFQSAADKLSDVPVADRDALHASLIAAAAQFEPKAA